MTRQWSNSLNCQDTWSNTSWKSVDVAELSFVELAFWGHNDSVSPTAKVDYFPLKFHIIVKRCFLQSQCIGPNTQGTRNPKCKQDWRLLCVLHICKNSCIRQHSVSKAEDDGTPSGGQFPTPAWLQAQTNKHSDRAQCCTDLKTHMKSKSVCAMTPGFSASSPDAN